jgi:tetratricopeptide (TPR) repeat protein
MIGRRLRHLGRRRVARHLGGTLSLAGLLRVHPDARDELLWEAARRLDAGAIDEARQLYALVTQLWIDAGPDALVGLAACAEHEGDAGSATATYDAVLAGDPGHLLALANRAGLHLRAGRLDAARADLDAAEAARKTARRVPEDVRSRLAELRARLAADASDPLA